MAEAPTITIVNAGYRSTNYWVVSAGSSRLLVDLGWPGMFGAMKANLDKLGVPIPEIKYGLATHYHIDHAGHAEELKRAGMKLLVLEQQVEWIPRMKDHIKPQDNYLDIRPDGNVVIALDESRALLETVGISGEIISSPGHSPDSVSLLLDDGSVFTGDLTHPMMVTEEQADEVFASWRTLKDRGAITVYAGHGPVRNISGLLND
ncbi:MAG: MBL fold metallo-hydrolase [Gemmatimonadaceae bacterium]|nr:MBL fold metallo-hydrolase [Gemmatimonadaceae bacterium]